jgi:hypothetical protein
MRIFSLTHEIISLANFVSAKLITVCEQSERGKQYIIDTCLEMHLLPLSFPYFGKLEGGGAGNKMFGAQK